MQLQLAPYHTIAITHMNGRGSIFAISKNGAFENVSTMHAQLMRPTGDWLQEQKRTTAAAMQKLPLGHSALRTERRPIVVVVIVFTAAATGRARYHALTAAAAATAATGNTLVHFTNNHPIRIRRGRRDHR